MKVQSYLFFQGHCDEAIAFYRKAAGATDVNVMRYKDSPEPPSPGHRLPPGWESKVMHASFRVGDTELMASDGDSAGPTNFSGFSLVLNVKDDAEAKRRFDALADGGTVIQPLVKTFFSSSFGMLTDRYGLGWMVIIPQA